MRTIWKFKLEQIKNIVKLPKNHEILSVINQDDEVMLYCFVDDKDEEYVYKTFYCMGTGWDLDGFYDMLFLGTVSTANGSFIWHVFTKKEEKDE